jgi:multiple sugar transport system substrate-binding protein
MQMNPVYRRLIAAGIATAAAISVATPVLAETVRMWTFLNPAGSSPREVALAQIVKGFEAANPSIDIVVEPQIWDQMSPKFLAAASAGTAPDVIWVVSDYLGDAINSGSLTDLNKLFIDKWPAEKRATFKDVFWDTTTVNGAQYGIFASRNYVPLIYRKDLFEQAGIKPEDIKTWADLRKAAEKLTVRDASGNVTRYGYSGAYSQQQADVNPIVPHILGAGEQLFTPDGKANFASPVGVAAAEYYLGMIRDGISPPQAANWTGDDMIEQFSSGRIAMIIIGAVRVPSMQAKLGNDKVGVMLLPSEDGKTHDPSVVQGWSVGVWSGSKVKEAAGKFVDYMMSDPGGAIWTKVGRQIPGMQSNLAAMQDFLSQPENKFLEVAAEGVATAGWVPPITFSIGGYRQAMNYAFQRMIVDKVDPKTALTAAEADFNRQNGR